MAARVQHTSGHVDADAQIWAAEFPANVATCVAPREANMWSTARGFIYLKSFHQVFSQPALPQPFNTAHGVQQIIAPPPGNRGVPSGLVG